MFIGAEKTGTTSIQEYLYINQKKLMKSGFYFIQSAGERNNRAFPACCIKDDRRDDFFNSQGISTVEERNEFKRRFIATFQDEIKSIPSGVHTVIISSEHLHSRTCTKEEVGNVFELLSSYFSDIKIVCYLREQSAACTSLYSTAIKGGATRSLEDMTSKCVPNNIRYNYYEMLKNWEGVFGIDSLDVALFDTSQFINGNLLDDFTTRISPTLVGKLDANIKTRNESLNTVGQILSKAINKAFPPNAKEPKVDSVRRECQKIVYNECRGSGEQPPQETQERIFRAFSDSNEKVRKKYFPSMNSIFRLRAEQNKITKFHEASFLELLSRIFKVALNGEKEIILPGRFVLLFRESALDFEKKDLRLSFAAMMLAHEIRPSGTFINKKLEEYRQRLNATQEQAGAENVIR